MPAKQLNRTPSISPSASLLLLRQRRCVLCGRYTPDTITSAGFFGTATDARICRDWRACDMSEVLA